MTTCDLSIAKQLNYLKSLSEEDKARLHHNSKAQIIKRGPVIFMEDELLQNLYCIGEGYFKFSFIDERGKEQITKLLGKGEIMGRHSVFSNKGALVTATAVSDTLLYAVDKNLILSELKRNNNFCQDVLSGFVSDSAEERLKMNLFQNQGNIKRRLIGLLLYIKDKFGYEKDGSLKMALKREDLASILGTSSEYVITLLSRLKKMEVISLNRGKINIRSDKKFCKFI